MKFVYYQPYDIKNKRQFCLSFFHRIKKYCYISSTTYQSKEVKNHFKSSLEIEKLYVRDHVDQMKDAILERINKNGGFTTRNCKFVEKPTTQFST
jgi:hypothetical protein